MLSNNFKIFIRSSHYIYYLFSIKINNSLTTHFSRQLKQSEGTESTKASVVYKRTDHLHIHAYKWKRLLFSSLAAK